MGHFTKMVSMAKTPEQVNKEIGPANPMPMTAKAADVPTYPWGLCLNLEEDQLDKLEIDGDCEVGDTIHLCALATVTSCSSNQTEGGTKRRIELQITHLATENEDAENEASERAGKRYGGDED